MDLRLTKRSKNWISLFDRQTLLTRFETRKTYISTAVQRKTTLWMVIKWYCIPPVKMYNRTTPATNQTLQSSMLQIFHHVHSVDLRVLFNTLSPPENPANHGKKKRPSTNGSTDFRFWTILTAVCWKDIKSTTGFHVIPVEKIIIWIFLRGQTYHNLALWFQILLSTSFSNCIIWFSHKETTTQTSMFFPGTPTFTL